MGRSDSLTEHAYLAAASCRDLRKFGGAPLRHLTSLIDPVPILDVPRVARLARVHGNAGDLVAPMERLRPRDCREPRPTLQAVLRDLLATDGVREVALPGSSLGVMALHGGLEEGTFEIARTVAEVTGASLYAVVQPDDVRWHVPSIHFDPGHSEALRSFVDSVRFAVSIHGFGRQFLSATALVGGAHVAAADQLAGGLRRRGFTAISDRNAIPKLLRGLHVKNPVNLPSRGGVQVELTPDLRRMPVRRRLATALAAEVEMLAPVWA